MFKTGVSLKGLTSPKNLRKIFFLFLDINVVGQINRHTPLKQLKDGPKSYAILLLKTLISNFKAHWKTAFGFFSQNVIFHLQKDMQYLEASSSDCSDVENTPALEDFRCMKVQCFTVFIAFKAGSKQRAHRRQSCLLQLWRVRSAGW